MIHHPSGGTPAALPPIPFARTAVTFNSFPFLVFAAVFFLFWPRIRGRNPLRWAGITAASFVFYGWWDWRYLFLLFANGLCDFLVALAMEKYPKRKRIFLAASIAANLGTLAGFKYLGFLAVNANALLATFTDARLPVLHPTLPIGISFYTFHSLSYIIDVYRGRLRATRKFLHFLSYLSLFPHLVAGPVLRGTDFLPQLEHGRGATAEQRWDGLRLIAHGFFKKVVIADNLAPVVNYAFAAAVPAASMPYWWLVTTLFAFQIYCDFSGYSDIARGLAKWMGYEFPLNFDHPYTSTSVREFWTRWHISLSSWFRDYVYVPLGGARAGAWSGHRNLWIAMLLSGLWHGAAWHFLAWAALHAFYVSLERWTEWPKHVLRLRAGRPLAWFIVLLQVWVAWVFFRAESFEQALRILGHMFDPWQWEMVRLKPLMRTTIGILALAAAREVWCFLRPEGIGLARWSGFRWLEPIALVAMLVASVYLRGPGNVFIYFQF